MTRKIVEVKWIDASYVESDIAISDVSGPDLTYSVGYLVRDESDHIAISQEISEDGKQLRRVTSIPRGMVIMITEIKKNRDYKKPKKVNPVAVINDDKKEKI